MKKGVCHNKWGVPKIPPLEQARKRGVSEGERALLLVSMRKRKVGVVEGLVELLWLSRCRGPCVTLSYSER
jgi:hypothetical protein